MLTFKPELNSSPLFVASVIPIPSPPTSIPLELSPTADISLVVASISIPLPAPNVIPDILPAKSLYILVIVLYITPLVNSLLEFCVGSVSVLILIVPELLLSPLPELTFTTPKPSADAGEIPNTPSVIVNPVPVPVETITPPMVDAVAALSFKTALPDGIYNPVVLSVLCPNIIPPSLSAAAVDMAISPGFFHN